jgi:hypothetical protein
MERTLKEILWLHLGASLDMLENAITVCPDELWERSTTQMGFWYMAYHALWFLDHDLTPADQEFTPPAFDVYNYELEIKEPPYEHPYSKSDVRRYLEHNRQACRAAIEGLDGGDSQRLRGCRRIQGNTIEVIVDQIRHIQHHTAQLNLLLRQTTDSAPVWVRRTKRALSP